MCQQVQVCFTTPVTRKDENKNSTQKVVNFRVDNKFLSSNEGGSRKNPSTVSTTADMMYDRLNQINAGNGTVAAFVDRRKAFITVNTKILTDKLDCARIRKNGSKSTFVNSVQSKLLPFTCGVSKGSVLGPLFFLEYVNDIQDAVKYGGIKLYAYETTIPNRGHL